MLVGPSERAGCRLREGHAQQRRERCSEAATRRWADPAYRARQAASRRYGQRPQRIEFEGMRSEFEAMARAGIGFRIMAERLGVSESALREWMRREGYRIEFVRIIKKAGDVLPPILEVE